MIHHHSHGSVRNLWRSFVSVMIVVFAGRSFSFRTTTVAVAWTVPYQSASGRTSRRGTTTTKQSKIFLAYGAVVAAKKKMLCHSILSSSFLPSAPSASSVILSARRKRERGMLVPGTSGFRSRSTITSATMGDRNDDNTTTEHRNLLSVEECLELFRTNHYDSSTEGRTKKINLGGGVRFVDGTWFHKGPRNGRSEFEAAGKQHRRILGSVYFDLDDITASNGDLFSAVAADDDDDDSAALVDRKNIAASFLSHMLPPPDLFEATMDEFGIRNDDHVIVYGRQGAIFLPRIWFTFHAMGHEKVSIMQGSVEEWIEKGGPVESEPILVPRARDFYSRSNNNRKECTSYNAKPRSNLLVVDLDEMKRVVESQASSHPLGAIVDARGSGFQKNGGMPGARNVPYESLAAENVDTPVPLNNNIDGKKNSPAKMINTVRLKSRQEIADTFLRMAGVDPLDPEPIYCTCGTGVSACTLYLALQECGRGRKNLKTCMYDGSWEEWSNQ